MSSPIGPPPSIPAAAVAGSAPAPQRSLEIRAVLSGDSPSVGEDLHDGNGQLLTRKYSVWFKGFKYQITVKKPISQSWNTLSEEEQRQVEADMNTLKTKLVEDLTTSTMGPKAAIRFHFINEGYLAYTPRANENLEAIESRWGEDAVLQAYCEQYHRGTSENGKKIASAFLMEDPKKIREALEHWDAAERKEAAEKPPAAQAAPAPPEVTEIKQKLGENSTLWIEFDGEMSDSSPGNLIDAVFDAWRRGETDIEFDLRGLENPIKEIKEALALLHYDLVEEDTNLTLLLPGNLISQAKELQTWVGRELTVKEKGQRSLIRRSEEFADGGSLTVEGIGGDNRLSEEELNNHLERLQQKGIQYGEKVSLVYRNELLTGKFKKIDAIIQKLTEDAPSRIKVHKEAERGRAAREAEAAAAKQRGVADSAACRTSEAVDGRMKLLVFKSRGERPSIHVTQEAIDAKLNQAKSEGRPAEIVLRGAQEGALQLFQDRLDQFYRANRAEPLEIHLIVDAEQPDADLDELITHFNEESVAEDFRPNTPFEGKVRARLNSVTFVGASLKRSDLAGPSNHYGRGALKQQVRHALDEFSKSETPQLILDFRLGACESSRDENEQIYAYDLREFSEENPYAEILSAFDHYTFPEGGKIVVILPDTERAQTAIANFHPAPPRRERLTALWNGLWPSRQANVLAPLLADHAQ